MTAPTTHFVNLRDGMLSKIREHFPKEVLREVVFHDGEFTVDTIEAYARTAPSLVLTMEGTESTRRGGSIFACAHFEAYMLTKKKDANKKTDVALVLIEHFLRLVHFTDWGFTSGDIKVAENVATMNLYGKKLDELGLALWVCRWEHVIGIPGLDTPATLDDFVTLHVTNTEAQPSDDPNDGGPVDEQTTTLEQDP